MNFQFLVESCVSQFKDKKITKKNAEAIIRSVFEDIFEGLLRGEKVNIRGFGTFGVTERKGRTYVEPRNQEKIVVGPTKYPKFIPSVILRDAIKGK